VVLWFLGPASSGAGCGSLGSFSLGESSFYCFSSFADQFRLIVPKENILKK